MRALLLLSLICLLPVSLRGQEAVPTATGEFALPEDDVPPGADDVPGDGSAAPKIPAGPTGRPQSLSEKGGQFHVNGGDIGQRRRLLEAGNVVRREVLASLRLPDQWEHPVVIGIRDPMSVRKGADPVWSSVEQTPGGFRIEVNVAPQRGSVPGLLLRRHLVRAVLAEWVLRGNESRDLSGAAAPPPDWLLHGTLELLDYRERGRPSDTFATVFRLGHALGVDEILNADPRQMDSVSLGIFRVSCCGLLLMLQSQPHSTQRMPGFLRSMAAPSADPVSLIQRAFPELSQSSNSVGKWWSLQVASMADPDFGEIRSPQETGDALTEALTLRIAPLPEPRERRGIFSGIRRLFGRDGKRDDATAAAAKSDGEAPPEPIVCDVADLGRYLDRPDREAILRSVQVALADCQQRAHPVYGPIIREYQQAIANLVDGRKTKETSESLRRLATVRTNLAQNMRDIADYLNWYEATSMDQPTGRFDGYLRTAKRLDEPRPSRDDPITRYMDAMEAELERK